ncbi:13476_t:CDS:2, partial [Funneliformis caledonium]
MFTYQYQHYNKTFSRQVIFRKHAKSHKGQAYWEIFINLSDNFNDSIAEYSKNTSENKKNNFDGIDEMIVNFIDNKLLEGNDQQEQEVDDTSFSVNEDEALDYTIEVEEFAFEHHDYNLHASKPNQISSINVRSILIQKLSQFPNVAYSEFMKLISTHHLSDSAGNNILKWFR